MVLETYGFLEIFIVIFQYFGLGVVFICEIIMIKYKNNRYCLTNIAIKTVTMGPLIDFKTFLSN